MKTSWSFSNLFLVFCSSRAFSISKNTLTIACFSVMSLHEGKLAPVWYAWFFDWHPWCPASMEKSDVDIVPCGIQNQTEKILVFERIWQPCSIFLVLWHSIDTRQSPNLLYLILHIYARKITSRYGVFIFNTQIGEPSVFRDRPELTTHLKRAD